MNSNLNKIKTEIYNNCSLEISDFIKELEGKEYDACQFELNGMKIICRSSKITPKKIGQFVTFWRRNKEGITEPFNENDKIDFYVINVSSENNFGQFVFPKSELINKGIISTKIKDGKRGFRVYPKWDRAENKQAKKTQKWQLNYFYEINKLTDLIKVSELYEKS
ncbi:MepB family protein [uncultured Polaribacter sp.]|uniref:MepB family protein n=1 Tax=uncultured Polaribacter sp. TaxID=174711 RepID=UPI00260288A8|nr:MepB family protein [uncultured Polaribacter sp.]